MGLGVLEVQRRGSPTKVEMAQRSSIFFFFIIASGEIPIFLVILVSSQRERSILGEYLFRSIKAALLAAASLPVMRCQSSVCGEREAKGSEVQ